MEFLYVLGQIFAIGLSTTVADCSGLRIDQACMHCVYMCWVEKIFGVLTMTFGWFKFQIDIMDKERFNTTVVLSHVTPGPVYVLTPCIVFYMS